MAAAADPDQTKTVELDRGLFLVQYQAADDRHAPPRVLVAPAPGSERKVEFVLHPDATEPTLWQPETALVVRAGSSARLQVRVVASRPQGSRAATVRVEPIRPGLPYREMEIPASAPAVEGMRIVAHVAGIGDVAVGPDVWIAGPVAPSRIEGLIIQWPGKPNDLELRYAVRFPGQSGAPNMVPLGAFAGTRGRALPVTALILEVAGRADVQLVAEALFLNSPILKVKGTRVALVGPTGREPMIGLRINLETLSVADPVLAAPPTLDSTPRQPPAPVQAARKAATGSRVKVFRSRPKQESSNS
jgi:hypothetical protein